MNGGIGTGRVPTKAGMNGGKTAKMNGMNGKMGKRAGKGEGTTE